MGINYVFKTKTQAIYEVIKNMITSGKHDPEEVFNTVDLAKRFGVSRTPVTEAVRILEAKGFLAVLPGVGFKIRKPSIMEIVELVEILATLEILTIRRAINQCTNTDIVFLKNKLDQIKNCLNAASKEEYLRLNEEFHFYLYSLSKYERLVSLQRDLWDWEVWYASILYENPKDIEILLDDHYKIVQCLKEKDPIKAEKIAHLHWDHCVEVLQKNTKKLKEV